jgi:hypothetical protein
MIVHSGTKVHPDLQPKVSLSFRISMAFSPHPQQRRQVQIQSKFWWHNPDLVLCTISGMQSENGGVMLLKFYLDPN